MTSCSLVSFVVVGFGWPPMLFSLIRHILPVRATPPRRGTILL